MSQNRYGSNITNYNMLNNSIFRNQFRFSNGIFMHDKINVKLQKLLLGFCSRYNDGSICMVFVNTSNKYDKEQGQIEWLPATAGFLIGILFLCF